MNRPERRTRRRGLPSLSGWRERGRQDQPVLSVVLTTSLNDVASAADALSALRTVAGDLAAGLEVVLVPWGPGNPDVVEAVAAGAPLRVRLLAPCASGNAARNEGAREARGEHVLFLDPLTRMRPGSLQTLLGAAGRERNHRLVRAVGDRNPFNPGSYLFRAAYLADAAVTFHEDHGDLPDATVARALSASPVRVDGQLWDRVRRSGAATGSMPSWSDSVEAWLAMVPAVRQMVHDPDKAQWIRDLLVTDVPGLLADAERLEFALLPELADVVGSVVAALPPNDLARVPVEARATAWLGGQARWSELAELLARRAQQEGQFPTRVEGTRIYAELPGVDWPALHAPSEVLEVGLEETRLGVSARRVRWLVDETGAAVLAVDVFALIRHLGLANPTVQARWVGRAGAAVAARVQRRTDPHVAVVSALRYQDQSHGSVTVLTRPADLGPGSWRLELAVTQGRVVRTGRVRTRDLTGSGGVLRPAPDGSAAPAWDESGLRVDVGPVGAFPQPPAHPVEVQRVRLEDGWLAFDLRGRLSRGGEPVLQAPGHVLAGHLDGDTVRFRLRASVFGLEERAAACGRYRLLVAGHEVPWAPAAEDETGFDLAGAEHRICVRRTQRGGVLIDLRPPLRDDELGPAGQSRLLTAYDVQRPLSDVVLLESASGRACTGGPYAVDRALARTRPGLRRAWVVEDLSVPVPDGAKRVLRRSREWHDLLATARLIVVDGDVPPFFDRRTGQLVLQTLAGYPARTLGVDAWNERNLAPRRIDHLVARTAGQWSALAAPSVRLEHFFRESFRYDGEVVAGGLPRTDLLLSADAPQRRAVTRDRLGIDEGQTVVFYAPEPGAHPVYAVRPREILDVADLAEALGPERTILLRDPAPGRRPMLGEGARVVDVSAHPEVADLMLASDVGLFDYSALRFDYALTGKPIVFQVPDPSVRRGDARGFLFPYVETAPGPVAATAADVAVLLADLEMLQRRQAPALARFNAEFNDMADGRVAERLLDELFGPRFRDAGLSLSLVRGGTADDQHDPPFRVVR